MVVFPGCKINIGLNIIEKGGNGYHNLESIFYPVELTDVLEIIKSSTFNFELTGIPVDGDLSNNLVIKAYEKLKALYQIGPVKIHLHKNVPLGAGLGGGSADASATLVLLNKLFDLNIEKSELYKLAAELGSDCPYFIDNFPAYVTGRGEIIEPYQMDLSGYFIQLINPGIHISTAMAFSNIPLSHAKDKLIKQLSDSPKNWKEKIENDFEKTIFPEYPLIKEIKETLYKNGALYASMTGTGSSVYGIFDTEPQPTFPNKFEWISKL